MFETLLWDSRIAARSLARSPGFTAVAAVTLALGIGGVSTMVTGINTVFLRPLPYPDEDRLVALWQTHAERPRVRVPMLDALDWRAWSRSFSHLAVFNPSTLNVTDGVRPERVPIAYVTPDFFPVLGVPPRLGRTFSSEESSAEGAREVVIGHALWQRVFGGNPGVVGRPLALEGVDHIVIGVMPRAFDYPEGGDLWLSLDTDDGSSRGAHNYRVIARMKDGVSLARTQEEMDSIAAQLAEDYPKSNADFGIAIVPLREDLLGRTGPVLLLLLGAVALVLLIACANVASLLSARALSRRGEATVRLALGANRSALVRLSILESVLLATLGGAGGLVIALIGAPLLSRLAPAHLFPAEAFRIDSTVLVATLALSLLVGLTCGMFPILHSARQDLRAALASAEPRIADTGRGLYALVIFEVALAFTLLTGAGLLLRSARNLEAVDLGIRSANVAILSFAMGGLSESQYSDEAWRVRFFRRLLEEVQALSMVQAAGLVSQPPLSQGSYNGSLEVENTGVGPPGSGYEAHYRLIGGDYFDVVGIPVLRGRRFSPADHDGAPKVAMVNQRLARSLAPEKDALGLLVRIPGMDGVEEWATVVGVVADIRHLGAGHEPVPEVYFPFQQRGKRTWMMSLVARVREEPEAVAPVLLERIRGLDPTLPSRFQTMKELVRVDLEPPRLRVRFLTIFAATALALAAVGIFGVVSYMVGQRHREIGIRIALGADRRGVQRLVLGDGLKPVLLGIAIGVAVFLALGRVLASYLFGIELADPAVFVGAAVILAASALVSLILPALRATRVDPVEVLASP